MIKLIAFLKRRSDLTSEEFHEHWRNVHGPLIATTPDVARHIHRYEQNHGAAGDEDVGPPEWDGVAVQWFQDIDAFMAFVSDPAYADLIGPDEERFLDRASTAWVITEMPEVFIDGAV